MNPLIRDVFERTLQPSITPVNVELSDKKTGFPVAQHRQRVDGPSAFKRARQQQQRPKTVELSSCNVASSSSNEALHSRDDIKASADMIFAAMSEEERAQGREDIIERFGPGIVDIMVKLNDVRNQKKTSAQPSAFEPSEETNRNAKKTDRPARRIRFVDPTESDIHVYERSPSSPKKPVGLLLPPPESLCDGKNIHSLQNPSNKADTFTIGGAITQIDDTPEAIRRKFFPSEPPPEDNPSLAWMLPQLAADQTISVSSSIRYSLSGAALSPSEIRDLPTHLGLHHHASTSSAFSSDAPAGYTIEDLLRLSRSSSSPQRVGALGVLGKILRSTYTALFTSEDIPMRDIHCSVNLNTLRRDIFDAAAEAVTERGWIGQRAVDVLWEIIVGCVQAEMHLKDLNNFPPVDLTPHSAATKESSVREGRSFLLSNESATFLATLPVPRLLSSLKSHLANSPSTSLTYNAILDILRILCHFEKHAKSFVDPLINSEIIRTILEPHLNPYDDNSHDFPNRKSIRVLLALSRSSREVAQHLLGPADILLKYVTTMQDELAVNGVHAGILHDTLSFYVSLMRYGLYTSVFLSAHTHFSLLLLKLHNILRSDITGVKPLIITLLELCETSIICATNPHQTTPPHDVTWSQIEAFGWMDQIFELVNTLVEVSIDDRMFEELELLWIRLFHVLAAWAEGAHINSVKNGEEAKSRIVLCLKSRVLNGTLGNLIHQKLRLLTSVFSAEGTILTNSDIISLSSHVELMNSYLRLSLATISPSDHLPYNLFVTSLSDILHHILEGYATSDIFHIINATNPRMNLSEDLHLSVRPLSTLLFLILRIRFLAVTVPETSRPWIVDALRVLHTFSLGDEYFAEWIVQRICLISDWEPITRQYPENIDNSCQRRLSMLLPFWSYTFIPSAADDSLYGTEARYANTWAKSEEVSHIISLHLPSLSTLRQQWSQRSLTSTLPLRSTWVLWPLDHLLRSAASVVLKYLPSSWDATELEVVQTTLWFTLVVQHLNKDYPSNLSALSTLSRAEIIFACMKVFMLEHSQGQLETGEIYRNPLVEEFLRNLLSSFTFRNTTKDYVSTDSLESASKTYLGERTPFYQFYADFLDLYASISYGHSLFAKLLLPPISSLYPPDYRHLLFGEYGHILRTINIDPEDVLSDDFKEYLWPIEKDSRLLNCYLNVLFKYTLHGFLRWFVIHHLAANIWSDLTAKDFELTLPRSTELLKPILSEDRRNTPQTKDILFYHQTKEGTIILPPQCYDRDPNLLKLRIHILDNYNVPLKETAQTYFRGFD